MITKFDTYINESYNSDDIFDASIHGDIDFIKDYKGDLNAKDEYGWTPLSYAVFKKENDAIKCLIKKGADINMKDDFIKTPLMRAASSNVHIVKYLIEHGADILIKDKDGDTAYEYHKRYFNSYEFQKWYMDTIGNYDVLNVFVLGNIDKKIKEEYPEDVYKTDIGL